MGYDLHITRKEFWYEEDGDTISLEEWQRYVAMDPEVESDPENPGDENYVLASHPERWPLWWRADIGEIYTKNPDDEVIVKLVQIARALNAHVVGDNDEIYGIDTSNPCIFQAR
jgi:hypothetical protein